MRVLFVSGYADQDTAELVLSEAKVGYLQKPFGPLDLARKVSEMISRRLRRPTELRDADRKLYEGMALYHRKRRTAGAKIRY
jgi:response regulator RpfG family c-di-GMP phosphodiesterase